MKQTIKTNSKRYFDFAQSRVKHIFNEISEKKGRRWSERESQVDTGTMYTTETKITDAYSLWGGSAGARMAAWVGRYGTAAFGEKELPQPVTVVMQYTGLSDYSEDDPPTFVTVGESDGIADWHIMKQRLDRMSRLGISTEFHSYPGLLHGFGIGTGTVAEGWLDEAIDFWKEQSNK